MFEYKCLGSRKVDRTEGILTIVLTIIVPTSSLVFALCKIIVHFQNEFCKDDNFGLSWVLSQVIKTSQPSLLGTTEEEEILVRQWLEYASTHLSHLGDMSSNDTFSIFKVNIDITDIYYTEI